MACSPTALLLSLALALAPLGLSQRTPVALHLVAQNSRLKAQLSTRGLAASSSASLEGRADVDIIRVDASSHQPLEAEVHSMVVSGSPSTLHLTGRSPAPTLDLRLNNWQLHLAGGKAAVKADGSFAVVPAAASLTATSAEGTVTGSAVQKGPFKLDIPPAGIRTLQGAFVTVGTTHELLASTAVTIQARNLAEALGVPEAASLEGTLVMSVNVQALGTDSRASFQEAVDPAAEVHHYPPPHAMVPPAA